MNDTLGGWDSAVRPVETGPTFKGFIVGFDVRRLSKGGCQVFSQVFQILDAYA